MTTEDTKTGHREHSDPIPCPRCKKPIGKGRQDFHDFMKHREFVLGPASAQLSDAAQQLSDKAAALSDVIAKLSAAESRVKELEAAAKKPDETPAGDPLEGALAVLSDHWTPEAWHQFGKQAGYIVEEVAPVADVAPAATETPAAPVYTVRVGVHTLTIAKAKAE